MRILHRPAQVVLAALALARAAAAPPADPAAELPVHVPAGVADAEGAVVCVRTPEGGVEAVDAASGRRLWASAAPSRALLVARGTAYLLEERAPATLRIAAYEARSGRPAGAWPLEGPGLPARGALAEPHGGRSYTRFDVRARLGAATLEVEHVSRQFVVSGFRREPGPASEVRGVVRLELGSGRVELLPGAQLPRPPFLEPAPAGTGLRLVRFHARPADAGLMLGGPPPDVEGVLVAGDRRVGFERPPGGRAVVVRRWGPGRNVPEASLEIAAETDAIWVTLDRRHVALRRARDQRFLDVHSLETGSRLATLERAVDIAVVGGRIFWTTLAGRDELVLVATEAGGGRAPWRRTVLRMPPAGAPIP